jgi:hypothetical protein
MYLSKKEPTLINNWVVEKHLGYFLTSDFLIIVGDLWINNRGFIFPARIDNLPRDDKSPG